MKKKFLSMLLCVAMLTLGGAVLTGCGAKDSGASGQKTEESSAASGKKAEESSAAEEKKEYTTFEEYIATPDGEKNYAEFLTGLGQDEGIKAEVKDNALICSYTIADITLADYDADQQTAILGELEKTMPATMESLSDSFLPAIEAFEDVSGIKGITVQVVYVDTNGETLYTHEYVGE